MFFHREDISATCFVGLDVISKVRVREIFLIDGQTGFKDECRVYSLAAIVLVAHLILAIFHSQNRARTRNRTAVPVGGFAHVKAGQSVQVKRSVCKDCDRVPVSISIYSVSDHMGKVHTSQPVFRTAQMAQAVILAQVQRCQLISITRQRCQILIPAYVQFYQFIMVTIQQCQVSLVFDIQLYQLIYRAIQLF